MIPKPTTSKIDFTIDNILSSDLSEQPTLDVDAFVNSRFSGASRGFAVVLSDGRAVVSRRVPPPPMLARIARSRLFDDPYSERRPGGRFRGRGPEGDERAEFYGGRGGGQGGPRGLAVEFAFINVNGAVAGIVAVPVEPPPLSMTLRDLGPTLAVVALGLLIVGTTIAALAIFRPASRRLRELQDAARAIGAGQVGVRAPVSGGDEVSRLAHSFNEMAGQLEQRTLALEQSDRTRRQLLADVSHELSTPLAAIRGYVETLNMAEVPLTDHTRRRYLNIVTDETERLEHIVGDLLELARLEGGGGAWREEDVPIDQLLERVRHRHEPRLREKRVTLMTERDPLAETVRGDPNRLEQALQNLVANAIRHTPPDGSVLVKAASRDGRIVLSVEDTGPGISPEHLPRIFDRFYKVDESRASVDASSGSGLGLSIVRAIVTRHGGTVTAFNVDGGGARFEIVLPAGLSETA
jgi:signal transduction histidine kinase